MTLRALEDVGLSMSDQDKMLAKDIITTTGESEGQEEEARLHLKAP